MKLERKDRKRVEGRMEGNKKWREERKKGKAERRMLLISLDVK